MRADQLDRPGIITNQVVDHLANDDLVVADLSTFNANVFYELAARHVTRKPVIHIIAEAELPNLPFDVNQIRAITYDIDVGSAEEAKAKIAAQARSFDDDQSAPDNPLVRGFEVDALRKSSDPVENSLGELREAIDRLTGEVREAGLLRTTRASPLAASLMADPRHRPRVTVPGNLIGRPTVVADATTGFVSERPDGAFEFTPFILRVAEAEAPTEREPAAEPEGSGEPEQPQPDAHGNERP